MIYISSCLDYWLLNKRNTLFVFLCPRAKHHVHRAQLVLYRYFFKIMNDVFTQLYAIQETKYNAFSENEKKSNFIFSIVINILGSIQVFTFYEMQFIWLTQKFEEKYSHSDSLGRITGHKSDCGWLKKNDFLKIHALSNPWNLWILCDKRVNITLSSKRCD